MSTLEQLRVRIREIDGEILRLIGARLRVAADIGASKRRSGLALRDWDVERHVLERAEQNARLVGVPDSLARAVMLQLIAESRSEQERLHYAGYTGPTEAIAIVGGRGRMGRWLADFLSNQGHAVRVVDAIEAVAEPDSEGAPPAGVRQVREHDGGLPAAIDGASVAFIATPLAVVPESIAALAGARFAGVVCDIASLKGHLRDAIGAARAGGARLTSIHPMFGPSARTLSDKVICVCDCGDAEATERVRAFFRGTAATLVDLSLEEHDRIMSAVLGLSHLLNVLFARVLSRSGRTFAQVAGVGSTTFHSQMSTTGTVVAENPDLYFDIQRLNPFTPELYDVLSAELTQLTQAVRGGDRRRFAEIMESGRAWMQSGGVGSPAPNPEGAS